MSTPIFFSDYDNTLIFSNRSVAFPTTEEVHEVEVHKGGGGSYLAASTLQALQTMSHTAPFVPTTTRNEVQYTRLHFSDVDIEYAIISNGAAILHNGVRDVAWQDYVRDDLTLHVTPLVVVQTEAQKILETHGIDRRDYTVENLFIYFHLLDVSKLSEAAINDLMQLADDTSWKLSIQKTKVYLIPAGLTKGAAVREVAKRLGGDHIIAAGDSILDLSMLEVADQAYMVAPGELADRYQARFDQVPGTGFAAATNLVHLVQDRL